MKTNTVTCSFVMDRNLYNAFKSVITRDGQNVKGCLTEYMKSVVDYEKANPATVIAIKEARELEKDPNRKVYKSFSEVLEEIEEDDQSA